MFPHNNNTKVVIAVSNILCQAGIQTLIKHIGVQPEYILLKSIQNEELEKYSGYLIVDYKIIDKPRNRSMRIIESRFKGKILLIGSEKTAHDFYPNMILPGDDKKAVVEKIQNFFTLHTNNNYNKAGKNEVLSARESDVLRKVAKGLSNKEISEQLFISINTVITHRKNITEKLGIKTISGLTVYALMNNLIKPEEIMA